MATVIHGTVKVFKEDKGFGFITPDGGGHDMFVHVTQVNGRKLATGDFVTYEVAADKQNRLQAINVTVLQPHALRR